MPFRYSAIDTAHTCLQKYKLQYVDEVAVPGLPSIDLEFGTALHAGLNAILEKDDGQLVFKTYWDSLKGTRFLQSRTTWEQGLELGELFLARFERLHVKHFEPFLMEERLSADLNGHILEGTPDYVGLYRGIPSVVDFKTSNYAYSKEKILINEQMPIYSHLVKQTRGYEAKQIVYYVFVKAEKRIQVVTADLTKELLDNALKNVTLVCEDLSKRKEFPRNPRSCMMGQYRCPYFSKCHGGSDGSASQ